MKITSNKSARTYTINFVYAKYRTFKMSKQEFDAIIQQVITDTDSRITALEAKFAELLEVKESKFKDERKKVELSKELTVKEILTKK